VKSAKLWMFFVLILFIGTLQSFLQAGNEQGIKPYGSFHGSDIDKVNFLMAI